jgi:hypothetical protein
LASVAAGVDWSTGADGARGAAEQAAQTSNDKIAIERMGR